MCRPVVKVEMSWKQMLNYDRTDEEYYLFLFY